MQHPGFFERSGPFAVSDLVEKLGAKAIGAGGAEVLARPIADVRPLAGTPVEPWARGVG